MTQPPQKSKYDLAHEAYLWMLQNISYDHERAAAVVSGKDPRRILHPKEVFARRKGICTDLAITYIHAVYALGIHAEYAVVERDFQGKKVNHACAVVRLPDRTIQVDLAYNKFDLEHQVIRIEPAPFPEEPMYQKQTAPQAPPPPAPKPAQAAPPAAKDDLVEQLSYARRFFQLPLHKRLAVSLACAASLWYGGSWAWQEGRKPTLQEVIENNETRFSTKHGEVKFMVDTDAGRAWKEALFYGEADEGNLNSYGLLDKYVLADKDTNNTISAEEARDALARARAQYIKEKR